MQASPTQEPPALEPPAVLKQYSTGYNALEKWVSTRQEQLANPEFPKTTEETQRLLDRFRRERAKEKKEEERKKALGVMEEELLEFQKTHERDFQLPQFTELEKVCATQ